MKVRCILIISAIKKTETTNEQLVVKLETKYLLPKQNDIINETMSYIQELYDEGPVEILNSNLLFENVLDPKLSQEALYVCFCWI